MDQIVGRASIAPATARRRVTTTIMRSITTTTITVAITKVGLALGRTADLI